MALSDERARPATQLPMPETRSDLHQWVRARLSLDREHEADLIAAIDAVFTRHERLWQESKQDAVQALAAGFAARIAGLKTELSAKDATVSSIATYFESLVANLTARSQQDPKTKLMNFDRFVDQLESFLALEQRGKWLGVGLVDITGFKWYNDALGHAVGDIIIQRVAEILQKQVRSDDLLAQDSQRSGGRSPDLHARLGGDEF
jgi:predicted signal transduction protein with EAL and GGDEF domain